VRAGVGVAGDRPAGGAAAAARPHGERDALLVEAKLSQRELAARSGVSPAIINRIVLNRAEQVALETLDRLSAALGAAIGRKVEPGELLEREPEPARGRRG
jgi:DNA-binding Xre family transcriptional regulator